MSGKAVTFSVAFTFQITRWGAEQNNHSRLQLKLRLVIIVANYQTILEGSIIVIGVSGAGPITGAVSRQSSSFCLILPITRPQSLWNLN